MEKVIVFGAGEFGINLIDEISKNSDILCFTDNDNNKHNTYLEYGNKKYKIINPNSINDYNFDKIIIASLCWGRDIYVQLKNLCIPEDKIIIEYISKKLKISTSDLFFMQLEENECFNRMDIVVRYLAVEQYYNKNDYGFKLYQKMQAKRVGNNNIDYLKKFMNLIKSYETEGYDENSYLDCDSQLNLMDGAHRLSLNIYHNIENIKLRVMPGAVKNDYSIDWFFKNGFSLQEIDNILCKYNEIRNKLNQAFIGVLWGPVKEYFDDIIDDLKYFYEIEEYKDFQYDNEYEFKNIVKAIYYIDDIAEWKVEKKLQYMDKYPKEIRLLKLKIKNPQYRIKEINNMPLSRAVERVKSIIRERYKNKISNYFHDIIIHISDNYWQSDYLKKVFSLEYDISDCFENMKKFEYALIKIDAPYINKEFPKKFPFHKDIDILCTETDFNDCLKCLEKKISEISNKYKFEIRSISYDEYLRRRLRIELNGFLIFQFDISTRFYNLGEQFVKDCIDNREEKDGYYLANKSYEYIIRLIESKENPQKLHHVEYLKKHRADYNEHLVKKYK